LLRIQLHEVMGQFLGQTQGKLGKIFEAVKSMRGVYLFDEFDALSPSRNGKESEVGEMRRVVASLLQFIEGDSSDSIIVAATNHHGAIDRAMFRRFDSVIEFPLPTRSVSEQMLRTKLLWHDGIEWDAVLDAAAGIGHADLVGACERVNKDAVMGDRTVIETAALVAAIQARRAARPQDDA
jgi:SpoVK/Ycf46/Vps4 family AAA+-type ATPase